MTEITLDAAVDVADTSFNNISSALGKKLATRFVASVNEFLLTRWFPDRKKLRISYFMALKPNVREEVIRELHMVRFRVPRRFMGERFYMLLCVGDDGTFAVHRVHQA